jgi:hypothetical protein
MPAGYLQNQVPDEEDPFGQGWFAALMCRSFPIPPNAKPMLVRSMNEMM